MTTVFHINLSPVLFLSKCMAIVDISYTVEPTGLLVRNINSTLHAFLETARMIVLLVCTYIYFIQYEPDFYVLQMINIVKFWNIIIAARLSAFWIIKFINGIIEFDQKITLLSTNLLIPQRSWKKNRWNMIFVFLYGYFIGFKLLQFYINSIKITRVELLIHHLLFTVPYVMDYVIVFSSCFFLQNMYIRFQTLIDLWKCLPAELVPVSDQWTHDEIVVLMENTRLLHSELCELLRMFTLGYGPMLLGFFIFSFINFIFGVYISMNHGAISSLHATSNFKKHLIPLLIDVQSVMFLMFIIVFVSIINEKRMKIISYLRLYRISKLHSDIKRQIKMFINQVPACDLDQISAFGFFDINLNIVTTMIVLFCNGIITLIQMKDHPMVLKFNNDTKPFFQKLNSIRKNN